MFSVLVRILSPVIRSSSYYMLVVTALLAWACKKKSSNDTVSKARLDSLQTVASGLNDSIQVSWQDMLTSDAQKLNLIDSLLVQIRQAEPTNSELLEQVTGLRTSLDEKRYTKPEELSSAQIDSYDAATDSLVNGIKRLYPHLKQPRRCQNCQPLLDRIIELDEKVLPFRLRYDRHAEAYNAFIVQNQTVLKQADAQHTTLKKKPLFRIGD